jgi:four helix bundle protein
VNPEGVFGLAVYKRSAALADAVRWAVRSWNQLDKWTMGVQLMRAADSVGVNIVEGIGRWSHADQLRFLYMARSSALEVRHFLERAHAARLPCPNDATEEAKRSGECSTASSDQ